MPTEMARWVQSAMLFGGPVLSVLGVSLVLIFAVPAEAAGGAIAGWSGGLLARVVSRIFCGAA